MDKVMIIGGVESGKSTLTEALLGSTRPAQKTQALNYVDWIVDTPGEYTENPLFYKAIMATLLEVKVLLFVQDATRERPVFPPGFAACLPKPAIGVITKSDSPLANIPRACEFLRSALGHGEIIVTSAYTGQGIPELLSKLGHPGGEQTSP